MGSPNWVLLIVQFSILKHLAGLTITLGDSQCGTQGTYSQNSAYQRNLNETLYALTDTYNGKGFFKKSSESAQADQTSSAYALALCLGDYYVDDSCLRCVRFATDRLRRECPSQKKATGWYYGICILSYSNSTLDMVNDYENNIIPFRTNYIQDWDSLLGTLGNLFTQVRGQADIDANNKTSHSSSITLPQSTGTIEATMQCIPNISQNICDECLVNATIHILTCCSRSAQVVVFYRYTCLLKYIIYSVNTKESLAPPPANRTTNSTPGKKTSNVIGPVVAAAVVTLGISMLLICIKFLRSCRKKGEEEELFDESDDETGEIIYYRLNEIAAATRNFSVANKLGEGGFGPVYLGELSDGKRIAVKRLSENSNQGRQEFKTEVKLIIKLQHNNLVRILGCCMKGKERLLVYEYMSHSSLDKYLFDPTRAKELNWAKRVIIVNGIAKGLRYLHEDSRLKIIHRDLKASNVLLDDEMNPKISDFGTAKFFGSNQVEANTDRVVGTYGYMAPEYAMDGVFSIKSDVYSFGVLLLEIISGKRNSRLFHQEHDQNLRSYAWMLWEEGKGDELIDENLNDDCPIEEVLKWLRIALLCIEEDPTDRPTMSSVAHMLEGECISLSEPKPPKLLGEIITSNLSSSTWNGDDFEFSLSTETAHKGKSVENIRIGHLGMHYAV